MILIKLLFYRECEIHTGNSRMEYRRAWIGNETNEIFFPDSTIMHLLLRFKLINDLLVF